MGQAAAQVLVAAVLMARVTEVAVLISASRVTNTIKVIRVVIIKVIRVVIIKVIRAVIINNPVKGVSSNNNLDIKVNRSS